MARREHRATKEQKLMRTWWVCAILFVLMLGLAYGFASLAIDSGELWQYFVGLIFVFWSINNLVRAIRFFSWRYS